MPHTYSHCHQTTAQRSPGFVGGHPEVAIFQPTHAGLKTAKSSLVSYRGADLGGKKQQFWGFRGGGGAWVLEYPFCHQMITKSIPEATEGLQKNTNCGKFSAVACQPETG